MKTISTFTFPRGRHSMSQTHALNTVSQERRECITGCGRRVSMARPGFLEGFKQRQKFEKVTCKSCKRGIG